MLKPISELLDNVLNAREALEKAKAYLHVSDHRLACQAAYEESLKQFEDVFHENFEHNHDHEHD